MWAEPDALLAHFIQPGAGGRTVGTLQALGPGDTAGSRREWLVAVAPRPDEPDPSRRRGAAGQRAGDARAAGGPPDDAARGEPLAVRGRGRRAVPGRIGVPRRGCRAPAPADGWPWPERRRAGRAQPGLEAGRGARRSGHATGCSTATRPSAGRSPPSIPRTRWRMPAGMRPSAPRSAWRPTVTEAEGLGEIGLFVSDTPEGEKRRARSQRRSPRTRTTTASSTSRPAITTRPAPWSRTDAASRRSRVAHRLPPATRPGHHLPHVWLRHVPGAPVSTLDLVIRRLSRSSRVRARPGHGGPRRPPRRRHPDSRLAW